MDNSEDGTAETTANTEAPTDGVESQDGTTTTVGGSGHQDPLNTEDGTADRVRRLSASFNHVLHRCIPPAQTGTAVCCVMWGTYCIAVAAHLRDSEGTDARTQANLHLFGGAAFCLAELAASASLRRTAADAQGTDAQGPAEDPQPGDV